MRRRPSGSEALFHSLSEFAYILLFLALGALAVLYVQATAAEARAQAYAEENERLAEEVAFLEEILEEKRHGVVPCWRRPEEEVPKVAGRIVIHDETSFTVLRGTEGRSVEVEASEAQKAKSELDEAMRKVLHEELTYAGEKNCYLRVEIENETNDFQLYDEVASIVTGAGMVVARE